MKLYNGDCLEIMKTLEDNSIDSIVTDPPYGLSSPPDIKEVMKHWLNDTEYIHSGTGFLNASWDSFVPNPVYFKEMYRVLKPGGHAFVFAGVRTQDLMGMSLRFAGFEIRETIMWLYSQGFPKSLNISKAIDKHLKLDREVVGQNKTILEKQSAEFKRGKRNIADYFDNSASERNNGFITLSADITKPACELSEKYSGYGTALKPAYEPIILVRKPISEKTIVENVMKYGTGGINIDACRISMSVDDRQQYIDKRNSFKNVASNLGQPISLNVSPVLTPEQLIESSNEGRFPANVIWDGSQELQEEFDKYGNKKSGFMKADTNRNVDGGYAGGFPMDRVGERDTYGDSGSISRFFYSAKVSSKERNEGLDDLHTLQTSGGGGGIGDYLTDVNSASGKFGSEKAPAKNNHPCLKPISLLSYLCKMITPTKGIVLDPYMGSGSCGISAISENFNYIGIELDKHYFEIAEKRIQHHQNKKIDNHNLDEVFK